MGLSIFGSGEDDEPNSQVNIESAIRADADELPTLTESSHEDLYENSSLDNAVVGYKKVYVPERKFDVSVPEDAQRRGQYVSVAIARLIIPAGARVYCSTSKCRAECAYVDGIRFLDDSFRWKRGTDMLLGPTERATAMRGKDFVYQQGTVAVPEEPFDEGDRRCASGIHFFGTISEAADW